jgi:hypothetical protein
MPSRVFISYSSKDAAGKDDPGGVAIRDTVKAALDAAGHDVFTDDGLKAGDEWRRRIRREIVERHVGIILFTPGALKSDWVWHEASIMSLVREFAPGFTLISALLEGVTIKDLKTKRFEPLGLDGFQLTKKQTPGEITQELVGLLGAVTQQKTLLEELGERIEVELAGMPEQKLRFIATKLGMKLTQWKPDHGLLELAMGVASIVLNRGMEGVHSVIREFAPHLFSQKSRALLDILAPLWVQPDEAGLILRIVKRAPPPWCVGLNGKRVANFTARMFLDRAYWPGRPEILSVVGGTGEDLVGHIREEMIQGVMATGRSVSREEADEYLRTTKERYFVNLPQNHWDKAALRELRATYPSATFILHTGETLMKEDDALLPTEFEALPKVDVEQETQAWTKYIDAMGDANKYKYT